MSRRGADLFRRSHAHEEDAERAVWAGLALVEAIGQLQTAAETPLQARVGIATGLVVVGEALGVKGPQSQIAIGETPNLAARLQGLAGPNKVVIAPTTQRLAGGLFRYRSLGAVPLKGFSEPIEAWQVLGPTGIESRSEALESAKLTPLVGPRRGD